MTEEEKREYIFKWAQLVQQEIVMWISINKSVGNEEFESMCRVRGFDKAMKNYLKSALESVYLKEGMKLPTPTPIQPKERPQDD